MFAIAIYFSRNKYLKKKLNNFVLQFKFFVYPGGKEVPQFFEDTKVNSFSVFVNLEK